MNRALRVTLAKQKAEAFLREEGIESLPVDPFAIAASRDIVVKPKPDAAEGVSGMLLRHGDAFGILYATHIQSEGFQRFSIAHELGHYFLDGHIDHILPGDGTHTSQAGFVSGNPYELEADNFAAGLLMPDGPFRRALDKCGSGLLAIESMANLCRTSLTATAIRYAELTDDAVAVIVSTGLTIDHCRLSETMKSLRELKWLRKGSPVPINTATAWLNANAERVARSARAAEEIDVMDWLGGVRSVKALEEVVGLGSYGKTLTVLTCPSIQDQIDEEEDNDDEDSLIERWTPRFRR
ncbi:MAG: ImmA/IrrE family metallo-endopeptidase [Candidatus Binataceae bacterium]